MSERYRIALLPGDGIGPEVTTAARAVVDATGLVIEWLECRAGADEAERSGETLPNPCGGPHAGIEHVVVPDVVESIKVVTESACTRIWLGLRTRAGVSGACGQRARAAPRARG